MAGIGTSNQNDILSVPLPVVPRYSLISSVQEIRSRGLILAMDFFHIRGSHRFLELFMMCFLDLTALRNSSRSLKTNGLRFLLVIHMYFAFSINAENDNGNVCLAGLM